jgi:hypothetical protein
VVSASNVGSCSALPLGEANKKLPNSHISRDLMARREPGL